MDLSSIKDIEVIKLYGKIIEELKKREIIRTKNVVGDLGEYFAVEFYSNAKGLPKLQFAPPSTENIDAISVKGERYSIKTTTSNTTGVFHGLNSPNDSELQKQLFEYAIIVMLNENYQLSKIIELNWDKFLLYKKWHSRMSAWYLNINSKLLKDATIIYDNKETNFL